MKDQNNKFIKMKKKEKKIDLYEKRTKMKRKKKKRRRTKKKKTDYAQNRVMDNKKEGALNFFFFTLL